jgi:hypothetical protein
VASTDDEFFHRPEITFDVRLAYSAHESSRKLMLTNPRSCYRTCQTVKQKRRYMRSVIVP